MSPRLTLVRAAVGFGFALAARDAAAAPVQPAPPRAPAKPGLFPADKAKALFAAYVKDELHGSQVKVEKLSEPMEADKVTAMAGKDTTAFYVTYSIYSATLGERLTRHQIMWVLPRAALTGKPLVTGSRDVDDFAKTADKEWLRKHPVPKTK